MRHSLRLSSSVVCGVRCGTFGYSRAATAAAAIRAKSACEMMVLLPGIHKRRGEKVSVSNR